VRDACAVPDGSDVTLKSRFLRYVASRSGAARVEEAARLAGAGLAGAGLAGARLAGARLAGAGSVAFGFVAVGLVAVDLAGGRAMATPF
jgi:uncharacterized protein YjbI with pentapeptide repeats